MADEPIEAGQFLGEDGAFQENWRDIAFPGDDGEALRSDPTLTNTKDIRSIATQLVNSQKTIGKLSGGRDFTILPNEQSTPEEIAAHHIKLGRPESAEGYELGKVQMPEGVPKDEKFIAKMGQVLFDAGVSKTASDSILKGYMEYSAELLKSMDTEDKLGSAEANKQLHTILGSAYDAKMASANIAIEALARPIDNDFAETLKKELPYDVFAARMLIKMGEMISEDKGLKGTPAQEGFTPADARAKANELMKDPYYVTDRPQAKDGSGNLLHPPNKQYHDELLEKVNRLFEIANRA